MDARGRTTNGVRGRLVALLAALALALVLVVTIWVRIPALLPDTVSTTAAEAPPARRRPAPSRRAFGADPDDPQAGEPGVGFTAQVHCSLPPGPSAGQVWVDFLGRAEPLSWVLLGQDGGFTMTVPSPSGEARVKVEGYAHALVRWEDAVDGGEGTCLPVKWRTVEAGVVVGRVVFSGEVPERVTVEGCNARTAEVDGDGGFYLEAAATEPCDVKASVQRGTTLIFGVPVEIDPADREADVELSLDPAEVRIKGFLGDPTRRVTFLLEPEGLRVKLSATTIVLADGTLSVEVAPYPPARALVTSVGGISTATGAEAQVELAERLVEAGTAFTLER